MAKVDEIAASFLQTGRRLVRAVGLVGVMNQRTANIDDELALLGYHDVVIILAMIIP